MKANSLTVAVAALAGLALAAAAHAAPSPEFLGTWALDLASAPPAPAGSPPAPKSVTMTLGDAGDGKWTRAIEIVDATGKSTAEPAVSFTVDGAPNPIADDPNVDSVTVASPDPSTIVATVSKAGAVVQKITVKLSADGKQQTSTTETGGVTQTSVWKKK